MSNSLGQILNKEKLKSIVWWAHLLLSNWLGKGQPSLQCLVGFFGWLTTLGLRHSPMRGSNNGESFTMVESLIRQCGMSEKRQCHL